MHGYIYMYICKYMYIYIYLYIYAYAHVYIYLHNSCMRACATVQQLPCHGSYCELILSLARTLCRLSFPSALLPLRRAGHPPAGQLPDPFVEPAALLLASSCSLKKSVQIHISSWRGRRCSVAQASSDHPRWCGPHPVCLWFTLAHGRGSHPWQKSIFAAIFAGDFTGIWSYHHSDSTTFSLV